MFIVNVLRTDSVHKILCTWYALSVHWPVSLSHLTNEPRSYLKSKRQHNQQRLHCTERSAINEYMYCLTVIWPSLPFSVFLMPFLLILIALHVFLSVFQLLLEQTMYRSSIHLCKLWWYSFALYWHGKPHFSRSVCHLFSFRISLSKVLVCVWCVNTRRELVTVVYECG